MTNDFSDTKLGPYFLRRIIGRGGMATVYQAYQPSIDREVAIKIMATELASDPEFMARFEREAQTIAKLQHPHILPVYDFGREGEKTFLVMRLMEGGTLAQELRAGALPIERVLKLTEQIASALDYAHLRGIVHRDLKPTNVLLDEMGNAYLTDFGIAKLLAGGTTGLTATGQVMGTPTYMAPEQWRSEPVDGRTDVYALGVILYQMMLGKVPFAAETPHGLMYQHLDMKPPAPHTIKPDVPLSIEPVIAKALAKHPDDRYASAGRLAQDLERALHAPARLPEQTNFEANASDPFGSDLDSAIIEDDLLSRGDDSDARHMAPTVPPSVPPPTVAPPPARPGEGVRATVEAPRYSPPPVPSPSPYPPAYTPPSQPSMRMPAYRRDTRGPFENWLWVVAIGAVVVAVLGGLVLLGAYWLSSGDGNGDNNNAAVDGTDGLPGVPTATGPAGQSTAPPTITAIPPTFTAQPSATPVTPTLTNVPPTQPPTLTYTPVIPTQAPTFTPLPSATPTLDPFNIPSVTATASDTFVTLGTPITVSFQAQGALGIARVELRRFVPGYGETAALGQVNGQGQPVVSASFAPIATNTEGQYILHVVAISPDPRGGTVESQPFEIMIEVVP